MKKTLHIIPHSHWDREWYMPFEKHRARLVELMDTLIETMERDTEYTHYHLDGQYIVIDDYLEIRPHMRERLMKLIREGRISAGPWYVLQDEYLTGGESNIRNMLYGMRFCREAGLKPLMCGYFPDAFGNIAQAPQLLRGFGIDNAIFGRGVNDASYIDADSGKGIVNSELIWRAPDGSEVLGVMFSGWYSNAMELPEEPEALKKRIGNIVAHAEKYAQTEHLLGMNGCDHQPVQTNLSRVIALANSVQNDIHVKQSSFEEYIAEMRKHKGDFPIYEGEINGQLSSGACPLICTASAHIDIKQDNYRVEHLLSRIAEPMAVMSMLSGGKYDDDMFVYAWKKLMQNHPHDSICTCSCDEVYDEMKTRFAKSEALAEALCDGAAENIAATVDTRIEGCERSIVLFSLDPHKRIVTLKAYADFDPEENVEAVSVCDNNGREIPSRFFVERNRFTYTLPKDSFRKVRYVDRFTIELQIELEGVGCTVLGVKRAAPTKECALDYTDRSAENQYLRLTMNENGSFDLYDKRHGRLWREMNIFEDTQDRGSLYNYVQPEGDVAITNKNGKAKLSLFEVTPFSVTLCAEIALCDTMDITTYVTLRDGVERVDIRTDVTNRGTDHRLRALFRSEVDTKCVLAEGQFDVISREITPAPTWKNPCYAQRMQAFAALRSESGVDSLMIATRGLCEYEVLRDGDNTLALTLLRSIGDIRDWGSFPTPKGQKIGSYSLEYSMIPYGEYAEAEAYDLGYSYAYPAAMALGTSAHEGNAAQKLISLDEPYVRISAIKRSEDGESVIVRLFNTHTESVKAELGLADIFKRAALCDLAENEQSELSIADRKLVLTLGAKKIVTVALKTK